MFGQNTTKIKSVKAREILDSRGNPTLEVEVMTAAGVFVAGVPSGASTGGHEAIELRDADYQRFFGKGVLKAAANVNTLIAPALAGMDVRDQAAIDKKLGDLDGTSNKKRLGANATTGVSLACSRAAAAGQDMPLYRWLAELSGNKNLSLPKACFNVINGGAHAGNELDVQEFMVVPQADEFADNLRFASEIYHQLKNDLAKKYGRASANLGDEGGFAPDIKTPEEALGCLQAAIAAANPAAEVKFIMDVASSQFFDKGNYHLHIGDYNSASLAEFYRRLAAKFGRIIGFEDPFGEDDWVGWQNFNFDGLKIGDDLLVTNIERVKEAQKKNACNAMIVKINQIGTLTEAIGAAVLAKSYSWKTVVSHRSGETNDDFIADFAVGINADYIKTGAPARGERLAKYNRLSKIEGELK